MAVSHFDKPQFHEMFHPCAILESLPTAGMGDTALWLGPLQPTIQEHVDVHMQWAEAARILEDHRVGRWNFKARGIELEDDTEVAVERFKKHLQSLRPTVKFDVYMGAQAFRPSEVGADAQLGRSLQGRSCSVITPAGPLRWCNWECAE